MVSSKNAKKRTADGSPIVTVRPMTDLSGGKTTEPVSLAIVEGKDGFVYKIPVDRNGRVPTQALVGRFHDVARGDRGGKKRCIGADLAQTATKTYRIPEGGFKPEELVENGWWPHPNECDIEGIDDTSQGFMGDFGAQAGKFEKATGGKIAIIAPSEAEKRRVAGVLAANFTASELKAAATDYGLTIIVKNPGKKYNGYYRRRQTGVDSPEIVLRPFADDETIVHEFGHHLRCVDAKRKGITKCPFPQGYDGRAAPFFDQRKYDAMANLEEAGNVAEVTGRTIGLDETNTGYYQKIPDHPESYQANFEWDRKLLTGGLGKDSKPKKGKRLMNAVEEDFDETRISGLKYNCRKTAKSVADDLRSMGEMPPKKPKAQTKAQTKKGTKQ